MRTPALTGSPIAVAFFDFERDGDATRCTSPPNWQIHEELRLPTDDPDWLPDACRPIGGPQMKGNVR